MGVGDADGKGDEAGVAWAGDALGAGEADGNGDATSVAVRTMIARSGTEASIRAGGTRQI
jgi:hypothetical protein